MIFQAKQLYIVHNLKQIKNIDLNDWFLFKKQTIDLNQWLKSR